MNRRTNEEWMDALRAPIDDEALQDLRNILLRGLRATLSTRVDNDLDALSEDFAQDALMKILKSLETFRGESRFTTWAQKIAIHVAFTELRRRRWKDISLQKIIETDDGDEFTPILLKAKSHTPEEKASQTDMMKIVAEMIDEELTERQRVAMLAVVKGGMPMEEIAERLGTNRNALYKLLFDARKRMQKKLVEQTGIDVKELLTMFEAP